MEGERSVSCPRCGTRMEYWVEIEIGEDGARRVKYYYKCPRCGYRLNDAVIVVRRVNGSIVLEKEEYIARPASRVGNVKKR